MIPDNHEWAIRYLRGTLKSIRKGKTSPNAWHGAVQWAIVLGVTAEEVEQIRLGPSMIASARPAMGTKGEAGE